MVVGVPVTKHFCILKYHCILSDIRKQLEGLGKRPPPSDRDSTAELLRELKEQEERNQRALEDLRRQLYGLNNQRVNVM